MLTQCAACRAVYRLTAADLAAANGFVICGECETQFNALERLADDPDRRRMQKTLATREDIPVLALVIEPSFSSSQLVHTPSVISEAPPIAASNLAPHEVPEILRADMARLLRRQRFSALWWGWSSLALLALIALLAQVSWEYRVEMFARFPNLRTYVERGCVALGCQIDGPLAVGQMELLARDVREHPQYQHALLVNATLANRGALTAKYPTIQLGIYDRTGGIVGVRRFQPREYLDASIDIEHGMPAARSVYLVLEIAWVSEVADSFEFTFY